MDTNSAIHHVNLKFPLGHMPDQHVLTLNACGPAVQDCCGRRAFSEIALYVRLRASSCLLTALNWDMSFILARIPSVNR